MANESVGQTGAGDCFIDLWEPISQLESVLQFVSEDLLGAHEAYSDKQEWRRLSNRAHCMSALAQKLAGELAIAAKVR